MAAGHETERETLQTQIKSKQDDDATLIQTADAIAQAEKLSRGPQYPVAQIPGYQIMRCLGEGAYGSVWLAQEQNTGKHVAVKFYTHRRGLDWSLLNREVEKLAVLYTSRNIIGLLDVGWDSDPPYYVMEYMENGSLAAFFEDEPLPPHEAVRIVKSVLQALVHAHGCGILHCDLKPANVLLDADFEPRLCDFGQSRLSNDQDPALGTLFYMAPEQADLKAVPDARWDVYALGALMYHLLSGEAPFRSAENERLIHSSDSLEERLAIYRRIVRNSPKPNAHRGVSGVDKRLADIVDRCLSPDPQKRYPNAQAVLDVLEIRERQRSRRPLIALGVVGPGLLMLAMIPIVGNAMRNAVQTAEQTLTERALESDVVSVKILASSVERELEDRMSELVEIAADPELRAAIEAASANGWAERTDVLGILLKWRSKIVEQRTARNRGQDTSWFLTDDKGFQRWREPRNDNTWDDNWAHRDYFHGRNTEYPKGNVPDDVVAITQPHISLAFRSFATKRNMVAVSVPVWDSEGKHVIGVLARTTHLGQLLAEDKESIRGQGGEEINRMIALVDNRDWKLLDHPWIEENLQDLPVESSGSLTLDKTKIAKLTRLRTNGSANKLNRDDRDDNYEDPVGRIDPRSYGGKWLAAFCPVGDTGWTAIVQERRSAAMTPVAQMQAGLMRYAMWALLVSGTLIGAMWYFVLRALNDRSLRNWNRNGSGRHSNSMTTIGER